MKHLYFIRHGQSTANKNGTIGGTTDWELTEKGKEQAFDAGKDAKNKKLHFDVIISSPLIRAYETAKLVAREVGYDIEDIELMPEIQERHFGELEGKHESSFGVSKEHYYQNPTSVDHFEDLETLQQLHDRAEDALKKLEARKEDSILIVSHAAFGRSLRKVINERPFHEPAENFQNAKTTKLI